MSSTAETPPIATTARANARNVVAIASAAMFIGGLSLSIVNIALPAISADIEATAAWFGNPEWGLGLPFPTLLAWLAGLSEAGGAILLLLGLELVLRPLF